MPIMKVSYTGKIKETKEINKNSNALLILTVIGLMFAILIHRGFNGSFLRSIPMYLFNYLRFCEHTPCSYQKKIVHIM